MNQTTPSNTTQNQTQKQDQDENPEGPSIWGSIKGLLKNYITLILVATAAGSITVFLYGLPAATLAEYFSIVVTGLLFGWAMFTVGALLGFLFGVPFSSSARSSAPEGESKPVSEDKMAETTGFQLSLPYRANTNLEQISDWLTKILVGVGLTQLLNIPKTLQSLGSALAPALGNFTNSGLFVVAELVYFGICGFLASFLWTRVNLPKLYAQADLDSMLRKERAKSEAKGKEEGRKEEGLLALAADMWGPPKAPAPQLTGKTPEEPMAPKYILWVDDQPEKNSGESKILREKLGVEIDTAFSTREALNRIDRDPRKYSLVISDMRRPESFTAGYDLLEKLLKQGKKVPYIIYSSGTTPDKQLEAIRKGAKGRPIGPVELYQMVSDVLSQPS